MPFTQTTLSALQSALDAKVDGTPFWTPDEATLALNDGLAFWNLLTGRWRTRLTHQTDGGIDVALPAPITFATRVTLAGRPLSPTSIDSLDLGRPRWRQETTASGGDVPTVPTHWAALSLQHLQLWPADAAFPRALVIDGIAATPRLDAAGDTVDLGTQDLTRLLNYALHVLSLKKGGPWFAKTWGAFVAFVAAAAAENDRLTTSELYRQVLASAVPPVAARFDGTPSPARAVLAALERR